MEISIGDYGRMMFEEMTSAKSGCLHWDSIRDEAKPLVHKLLELNNKMKNAPYQIVGIKENGKKVLSKAKRIEKAQVQMWGYKACVLKEGDYVWLNDNNDHEMYIRQDDPVKVIDITKKGIYLAMHDIIERINIDENILLAPADFHGKEESYTSDEYWLKQADALGI
jgi:hypothetical protein